MSNPLWSLQELNDEAPDNDHLTTVCSLEAMFRVSADLRCWEKMSIPVREIEDPGQLVDPEDPENSEDDAQIEDIRAALREGRRLAAVIIVHDPKDLVHQYWLMEGMHRYNAAHREDTAMIYAWVAHIDCCNGPAPDL